VAFGCAGLARAQDIRIDFSTVVGLTGPNWNNIINLTGVTNNLIDFPSGSPTTVSISGAGSPWLDSFGPETFPNRAWLINTATFDGAGLNGVAGNYVLSGLTGGSYTVELVSAQTSHFMNLFSVNGVNANRTELGTPVNTPWDSLTDGLTPGNWLIWDNVTPVGGQVTITDGSIGAGILNAMRISLTAVPEPTTWALIGAATLVTGAYAWRKKRLARKNAETRLRGCL
jgi:hypothetical protein